MPIIVYAVYDLYSLVSVNQTRLVHNEHLSAIHRHQCSTWDEMAKVIALFVLCNQTTFVLIYTTVHVRFPLFCFSLRFSSQQPEFLEMEVPANLRLVQKTLSAEIKVSLIKQEAWVTAPFLLGLPSSDIASPGHNIVFTCNFWFLVLGSHQA